MKAVLSSHRRLEEQYQLIIVEGAGSPAEINLREGDIANMGFAEEVDCPVIIIADIDKGGVLRTTCWYITAVIRIRAKSRCWFCY